MSGEANGFTLVVHSASRASARSIGKTTQMERPRLEFPSHQPLEQDSRVLPTKSAWQYSEPVPADIVKQGLHIGAPDSKPRQVGFQAAPLDDLSNPICSLAQVVHSQGIP